MAKIDVVVPCYNYDRFLKASVTSILEQSIKDLRILIIDDCSSDDSLKVATALAEIDPRITVMSHPKNRGMAQSFNDGIAWASSDYLMIFSADDVMAPGALERAIKILDAHPQVVLAHGDWIDWDYNSPVPDIGEQHDYTWSLCEGQKLIRDFCAYPGYLAVHSVTMVTRTSVQKKIGNYHPHLPHTCDWNMIMRFAMHGAVARITAVQTYYRLHISNMSSTYTTEKWPDFLQRKAAFDDFFMEYADHLPNSQEMQAQLNRNLAEEAFCSAIGLICRGQGNSGFKLLRLAIDLQPSLRYRPPLARLARIPNLPKKIASAFSIYFASLLGRSVTPWDRRWNYNHTEPKVMPRRGGHN